MKKFLAMSLLAVSAVTLLASCSSATKDNLNSRVPINAIRNSNVKDRSIQLNPAK